MSNPTFGLPSPTLPVSDAKTGLLKSIWYQFFVRIAQLSAEQPISSVTVTASPFTYTAATIGNLFVSGGTVSSVVLGRGTNNINCATGIFIPMAANDTVKVTYTGTPTINFVPSARA